MGGNASHFEIGAPDTGRAQAFFGELLGWEFQRTEGGAEVETGTTPGGIHRDATPAIQLFFEVPDLGEAARRVVELGGEVGAGRSEGPGGRYLHSCRDDQGVPFGLHEVR